MSKFHKIIHENYKWDMMWFYVVPTQKIMLMKTNHLLFLSHCSFPLPSDSKCWLHAWIKFYHLVSLIKLLITFILSKTTKYKWYTSFLKRKQMRKYVYFEIKKYQNICNMHEK
jgi:hypothetical protein